MDEPSEGRPAARAGRHRRTRRGLPAVVVIAAVAATVPVLVAGGVAVAGHAGRCRAETHTLRVAAAAEIAPAVAGVALRARTDPGCWSSRVVAGDSADGAGRPGADVWIPTSSIWLPASRGRSPSIARSPVVLALDRRNASRLGWPGHPIDPLRLLRAGAGGLRLALPRLGRSAPEVAALAGLGAALGATTGGRAALVDALQPARFGGSGDPVSLLAAAAAAAGAPATAVPTTEQAVWSHDRAAPAEPIIAAYAGTATAAMDYPFVVLTRDPARAAAAKRLLAALRAPAGRRILLRAGFRDPDGFAGAALAGQTYVDSHAPAGRVPTRSAADAAVRTLDLLTRGSRMLAVVDVSGSMQQAVPGAGGATRFDLVRQALARGLALFPDDADLGLWVFSTWLTATTDYREITPIGPLTRRPGGRTGRALLAAALPKLAPIAGGGTGLYDTVLAAVKTVRAGWDPQRVNSVLLVTDGQNVDPGSGSLADLLAELRTADDPVRPVRVITIGYGPGNDTAVLRQISMATGGATFLAKDPRDVERIFLDAIGQRACDPACPTAAPSASPARTDVSGNGDARSSLASP